MENINAAKEKVAISVKAGKFQTQIIRYGSDGVSIIEPMTEWTDFESARRVFIENSGVLHPSFEPAR